MKKRPIIGVIFFNLLQDSYRSLIGGISSQACELGCDVIFYSVFNNDDKSACSTGENNFYLHLQYSQLDGIIFVDSLFWAKTIRIQISSFLHTLSDMPVMCLDSSENSGFYNVGMRNKEAFEDITTHLITQHSYRKIYCLTGQKENRTASERLSGYLTAMEKNNIPVYDSYIYFGGFTEHFAEKFAQILLDKTLPMPEAVVCANDTLAVALIKKLNENNICVPGDVAVTGFDGTDICCINVPSVSTYKNMHAALGSDAVVRLYNIITKSSIKYSPNSHGEFVAGESCGCRMQNRDNAREIYERERSDNESMYSFAASGMLEKMACADITEDAMNILDGYLFMIGHFKKYMLCIHPSFFNSSCDTQEITTGIFERINVVSFSEGPDIPYAVGTHTVEEYDTEEFYNKIVSSSQSPGAYFITPLIFAGRYYGFSVIEYNTADRKPDSLYCLFNSHIACILDRLFVRPDFPGKERSGTSKKQHLPDWLYRLTQQMDKKENFTEGFTRMIALANMSQEHISREFRKYLNMSPTEYINRRRISYAAKLIEDGMSDLFEISEICGFNSVSHFYHLFRKYMNTSPGQFMKNQKLK